MQTHNHSNKKDCRKTLVHMSEYVDGDIGAKEKKGLEDHFANCKACKAVFATLKKTIGLFRRAPVEKLSPADARAIRSEVKARTEK